VGIKREEDFAAFDGDWGKRIPRERRGRNIYICMIKMETHFLLNFFKVSFTKCTMMFGYFMVCMYLY
jgi:hypothetical protein